MPLHAGHDWGLLFVAVGGARGLPPAFDAAQRPVELLEEADRLAGVQRWEPDALPKQPQCSEFLDQRRVAWPTRRERAGEAECSDRPLDPCAEVMPPTRAGGIREQLGAARCDRHLTVVRGQGQPRLGSWLPVLVDTEIVVVAQVRVVGMTFAVHRFGVHFRRAGAALGGVRSKMRFCTSRIPFAERAMSSASRFTSESSSRISDG